MKPPRGAAAGAGNTELMKLCCVQLFSAGLLQDVLLIWRAKVASMDADASIDVHLLCGAGLNETKAFLESLEEAAKTALVESSVASEPGTSAGFLSRN
jgi:hypothetical protein